MLIDGQQGQTAVDASGNAGSTVPCLAGSSPLALARWVGLSAASTLAVSKCSEFEHASSPWPLQDGNANGQNSGPKLGIATFIARNPGQPDGNLFKTIQDTVRDIKSQIPPTVGSNRLYVDSLGLSLPLASTQNFFAENGVNGAAQIDLLAFIGDSDVLNCDAGPTCHFSDGFFFTDHFAVRTPNCDLPTLGLCYYLDTVDPVPHLPPCRAGETLVSGNCYYVLPPCAAQAVQIGSFCFRFPTKNNLEAILVPVLLTSAKVRRDLDKD